MGGLPKGSTLTAIFDSCTSGTLLGNVLSARLLFAFADTQKDLDHYKCNNVYRPWVNKGGRRSNTLRNCVGTSPPCAPQLSLPVGLSSITVRKNCRSTQSPPPSRPGSMYRRGSGEANVRFPSLIKLMMDASPDSPLVLSVEDSNKHHGQRTASPERQFTCDGWCRTGQPSTTPEHGDVVCWVSSHPSIPVLTHLLFRRYPFRLLMTVKFLGMQARRKAGASR